MKMKYVVMMRDHGRQTFNEVRGDSRFNTENQAEEAIAERLKKFPADMMCDPPEYIIQKVYYKD